MVNSFLLVLSIHNHYADYFVAGRGLPCISIIFIKQVKKEEEEWRVRRGSSECFLNRLLTGRCQQPRVKLKASCGSLYRSFLLRRTKNCLYCLEHQQFISYGTFFTNYCPGFLNDGHGSWIFLDLVVMMQCGILEWFVLQFLHHGWPC